MHGGGFYRVEKFRVAPNDAARAALLVQVGGLHDVALGLRAPDRRLLRPCLDVSRRPVGRRPDDDRRRSCISIAGLVLAWLVYDTLAGCSTDDDWRSPSPSFA